MFINAKYEDTVCKLVNKIPLKNGVGKPEKLEFPQFLNLIFAFKLRETILQPRYKNFTRQHEKERPASF
jgi:predicted DNA-binding antitoxin AbrB/MazE fold protein